MSAPSDTLLFGVLGRAHGIRGEIVLRPYNPDGVPIHDLELPLSVELGRGDRRERRTLVRARPFQGDALVAFEGVVDRDAAAALTGAEVYLPRAALPPPSEDEVYVEDLLGCSVYDLRGKLRGKVAGAFWNGGQDVLTVRDEQGGELLVPAVPDFIREIDLEQRRLVIDDHE
jgi:16S rRNA processing protein RimM